MIFSSTNIRQERFRSIRIGLIGTGRMAPRFVSEAKYVSGAEVTAAYNPQRNELNIFQSKNRDVECFYTEFEKFLEEVDAVYIASPNETHFDYAKMSLEAGKHVLSEKPDCLKAALCDRSCQTWKIYLSEDSLVCSKDGSTSVETSGKICPEHCSCSIISHRSLPSCS